MIVPTHFPPFSLSSLRQSSQSLCERLMSFIHSNGGLPVPGGDTVLQSRRAGNSVASCLVAFPTRSLFFNGAEMTTTAAAAQK